MSARLELQRARVEHATALVQERTARLELLGKLIGFATGLVLFASALVGAGVTLVLVLHG